MELQNTPDELRNATIELLNYLLLKNNIDAPLYRLLYEKLFLPLLSTFCSGIRSDTLE